MGGLSGLHAWIVQRVTAVYMAAFLLYLLMYFLPQGPRDHATWLAWLSQPLVSLGLGLFCASLLLHVWVGVRDVILDYVKPAGLRFAVLSMVALGLWAQALWALIILLETRP